MNHTGTPVLVTTSFRGVFFGYIDPVDLEAARHATGELNVSLTQCRNIPRWRNTRGFLGLAAQGPNSDCRVGPPAPTYLARSVTSIATVTPEAAKAWEAAPWAD